MVAVKSASATNILYDKVTGDLYISVTKKFHNSTNFENLIHTRRSTNLAKLCTTKKRNGKKKSKANVILFNSFVKLPLNKKKTKTF